MCGICGRVAPEGVSQLEIERMAGALTHRGPDDVGFHVNGMIGLGHRRLSIIDLNTGKQPIANEDGSVWVVLNGEIYNYRKLRQDLVARGHRFKTQTDTEVIVHLYEEYGTDCVKHLRGMFAFAVWDEKRQSLYAARDHLGQKPFFFFQRGSTLAFASEIKALLAYDPSLAQMDLAALDQYLALRIITPPRSMFHSIRKLAPAHSLTFNVNSGLRIERYWELDYEPKHGGSEDDVIDELEARVIDCLRLHMVSDVPVGAFMSGGLDSTLVVAMLMKHVTSEPIQTFSVGVPYGQYNEAPVAHMVAEQYKTHHREKTVIPSLIPDFPKLVWHLDEPSDSLAVCSYLIAEMASKHVKVVLGGDGGDELFGGYDRYYGNRFAGYYALLPESLRKDVIGRLLSLVPDGAWYKSRGHQFKWIHQMSFWKGGERYARSLGYFYFEPALRAELYGHVMRELMDGFDPGQAVREAFERANALEPIDRMLSVDSQLRMPDHPVMILDRMTMVHGLEARSPFMDHEIAEFAACLPMRLKVRGRSLRYIERRLAERYLPKTVLDRPKQGFSQALPYLLKEEYRLLFKLFLRDSHMTRDGFFRQPAVDRLLNDHLAGRADHGSRLWLLLNSEVWYRIYMEGLAVETLSGQLIEASQTEHCAKAVSEASA
jgi:asparagine synthase (glutamine-hydrolysing)